MKSLLYLAALGACGRIDFEPLEARPDGAIASCISAWKSGAPELAEPRRISELSAASAQGDPSLSRDGLEMFFSRGTSTAGNLYVTTRVDVASAWNPPVAVSELNTSSSELRLTLSSDGTTAFFLSDRSGSFDLWTTTRAGRGMPFAPPTQTGLAAVNSASFAEHNPELSGDDLTLYFAPQDAAREQTVQRATRATPGDAFGTPTTLGELAEGLAYADATLSPDELVIVYAARDTFNPCSAADRCFDLYFASRNDRGEPFNTPQLVPTVDQFGTVENDPELSSDGCELYFSSTREGTSDLYVARVTPQ